MNSNRTIRLPAWAILAAPVIDIFFYKIGKPRRIVVAPVGEELRMYCVTSKEALVAMKGNRGKLVAQAGHGYLHAFWDAERRDPITALRYRYSGAAAKIGLAVENGQELEDVADMVEDVFGTALTMDAGRTVFAEPTLTTLGVGPCTKADVNFALGEKKMLI